MFEIRKVRSPKVGIQLSEQKLKLGVAEDGEFDVLRLKFCSL